MLDMTKIKVGDEVHYQPDHYDENQWENGIVKEVPLHIEDHVRVVYNCAGNWHRYADYTSALTHKRDLFHGWRNE